MFSEDFYNSLTDLIDRLNKEEEETGDKLGIVYTRNTIEEVFKENPDFLNVITLSFDGKIILNDDEDYDNFFMFLSKLNEKGISEVLTEMAKDGVVEVLTDASGEIYYKKKDNYDLNYDPTKDKNNLLSSLEDEEEDDE